MSGTRQKQGCRCGRETYFHTGDPMERCSRCYDYTCNCHCHSLPTLGGISA